MISMNKLLVGALLACLVAQAGLAQTKTGDLCVPPPSGSAPALPAHLMTGQGTEYVHLAITTTNPDAQKFFDQGLAQLHSFWAVEAERSFLQAAALDPDAPMPWWGVAMVASGELPSYVPNAFIAIEDRRFRDHIGLDVIGLVRAALQNVAAGHVVQGGSTLTQQLAKNLFLQPERTFDRKGQEALLALYLESRYSKDQILKMYFDRAYMDCIYQLGFETAQDASLWQDFDEVPRGARAPTRR